MYFNRTEIFKSFVDGFCMQEKPSKKELKRNKNDDKTGSAI